MGNKNSGKRPENLQGQVFGRLEVLYQTDSHIHPSGQNILDGWLDVLVEVNLFLQQQAH